MFFIFFINIYNFYKKIYKKNIYNLVYFYKIIFSIKINEKNIILIISYIFIKLYKLIILIYLSARVTKRRLALSGDS